MVCEADYITAHVTPLYFSLECGNDCLVLCIIIVKCFLHSKFIVIAVQPIACVTGLLTESNLTVKLIDSLIIIWYYELLGSYNPLFSLLIFIN